MHRLIGRSGSAGGHKESAGGAIPLSGMAPAERKELINKLINKFLTLINRKNSVPKPFVQSTEVQV
jgi:hypothetical protein